MDKESKEENAIDIEFIDPIDSNDIIILTDETERTGETSYDESFSDDNRLKTGSILSQFFNVIAQIRDKDFWRLNTSEIKSLNKTCPKILPKVIAENSGIIGCILSLFAIIVKRIKLEKELSEATKDDNIKEEKKVEGLTGSRGG